MYGMWWLKVGPNVIGYWPENLFTRLQEHGTYFAFWRDILIYQKGPHTSTQMGSGQFSAEGFGKASYIRNMDVVDGHFKRHQMPNVNLWAETPNCYDVTSRHVDNWACYIYFGGLGNNPKCP